MTTTLYRFFDADDVLLYIGIASNPARRFEQHAKTKSWWGDVVRSEMEHHEARADALDAEREAIIAERPRFNLVHNRGHRALVHPPTSPVGEWTYRSRSTGHQRTEDIYLYAELDGSSCIDQIWWVGDGLEQLDYYVSYLQDGWPSEWAADAIPIVWSVQPACEPAPFTRHLHSGDFLDYFIWPENAAGDPLDWFSLPVRTDVRYPEFAKALGWKPSPFQPTAPLRSILNSKRQVRPRPRQRRTNFDGPPSPCQVPEAS